MTLLKRMLHALPLVMLLIVPQLLASCQTTGSPATDSFCAIAKPIRWSHKDTAETIEQAQELNAVGAKLCGWKP